MSKGMYAEYLKERLGDECLETEWGFATYRYPDEKTVYVVDLYVRPDFRKNGVASAMADRIAELALKKGCTRMIGSVVPSARGSTESVRVLLSYGMKLDSSANDFILFKKELS